MDFLIIFIPILVIASLIVADKLIKKWRGVFVVYHNIVFTHNMIFKELFPIIVCKIDEGDLSEKEKEVFEKMKKCLSKIKPQEVDTAFQPLIEQKYIIETLVENIKGDE